MGKTELSLMARWWSSWTGATTTWAPVSVTDFCCGARPALGLCLSLGGGSDSDPYAALSRVTETGQVGAEVGLPFFQPSAIVWTWWGSGNVVTGEVVICLR